jgi:tight adherence protein B
MTGALPLVAASTLVTAAVVLAVPIGARGRLRMVARPVVDPGGAGDAHQGRGDAPDGAAVPRGQNSTPVVRLLGAGNRPVLPTRIRGRVAVPMLVLAALLTAVAVGPVVAGVGLAYGLAGRRALRRRAASRADDALRVLCAVALAGLADDLRAGRTPSAALHAAIVAVENGPVTGPVASALAAVRIAVVRHPAGEVPTALRAVPGPLEPAFRRLAAAWTLTDCGIPLADVVGELDVELRRLRRLSERAAVHIASARTTARLVAGLPVLGLGVGQLLGAGPVAVLTETPGGAACAAAAVTLHLVGFSLARRLSRVVPT